MRKTNEVYTKEIEPLLQQLKAVCATNEIPYFACFYTGAKNGETDKKLDFLSPNSLDIKMPDASFYNHMNVYNGFETIPPHEVIEIDFDAPDV